MSKYDFSNAKNITNLNVSVKDGFSGIIDENNLPDNLKDLEDRIKTLKERIGKNIWLIGQALTKIRLQELYKDKGYQSFKEYCEVEFDFSRATAYRFIFVFEKFKLVTSVRHGSKLYLLERLRNDPEEFQKCLEWIDNQEPSRREVDYKIKEIKANTKPEIINRCKKKKHPFKATKDKIVVYRNQLSKQKSNVIEDVLDLMLNKNRVTVMDLHTNEDLHEIKISCVDINSYNDILGYVKMLSHEK